MFMLYYGELRQRLLGRIGLLLAEQHLPELD